MSKRTDLATFAGGCFWCMIKPFEQMPGVRSISSGYTGGQKKNPTYEEVIRQKTGHYEAVQINYDPELISYERLLELYWRQIDPTDAEGQFHDRGVSYKTAIFYHDEKQKELAEASKKALQASERFDKAIVTQILPYDVFYPAEDYHQEYHKKQSLNYKRYRHSSGRDAFISRHWQEKEGSEKLRKILTPLQFQVTQNNATEPPFQNEFWNHKEEGLYVDIISGEPLFSSRDKFDSSCGWPSFTKPLAEDKVKEEEDYSYYTVRTEVRSGSSDAHLGHVFDDGPAENGLRYCINSAALRFIPKRDLAKEGYSDYLKIFT